MERTQTPPEEFMESLPADRREEIRALDTILAPIFEGHERAMWEGVFYGGTQQRILGYGVYHYRGRSGAAGEWFVVGIAVQKDHLTFYATGAEDGQSLIKRHGATLGKAKLGSGSATFRRLADVEVSAVAEIATRARDVMAAAAS